MPIMAIGGIPLESARFNGLILTSSIIYNQVYTANIGSDCQKNSKVGDLNYTLAQFNTEIFHHQRYCHRNMP
jgi:hypothetical protein